MLVDVHAHLHSDAFANDLSEVLERAKKARIAAIINNGTDRESNKRVLDLAKQFPLLKAALGLYPSDAVRLPKEDVDNAISFIFKHRHQIVGIGEVGMDLKEVDELRIQQQIFEELIELAQKIRKPLIVHSRKAELDVIKVLEGKEAKKVIMHCFSGSLPLTQRIERNGWFLSIPPNVVFSSHFQRIVEEVAIEQLLTETDAPYLAPEKGKRNEPSYIVYTIKKIAEIKKLDAEEVEKIIFMNYQKIFLK